MSIGSRKPIEFNVWIFESKIWFDYFQTNQSTNTKINGIHLKLSIELCHLNIDKNVNHEHHNGWRP
jgi:hypothetical protein